MKTIFAILSTILFFVNVTAQDPNSWTQKIDFGGTPRADAAGFGINGKIFLGTGYDGNSSLSDFWSFDPAQSIWEQKANYGGGLNAGSVSFTIGVKGYIGVASYSNYFWEFDPNTNVWTQKADFAGYGRQNATGFSIGSKGYIGIGYGAFSYYFDFWEYDPSTNNWTRKADFLGRARGWATGFSIGEKGYIGTGRTHLITGDILTDDFWEYDPDTDTWSQKSSFPGGVRERAVGFSIGNKGYLGLGTSNIYLQLKYNDFWEFDPGNNTWTKKADFPGLARFDAVGIGIDNKGYIGLGNAVAGYKNDWWQYTPDGVLPLHLTTFTATLQKANALLNWQTANEINTSYFNIQRSYNGVNFTTIAKQNAAANSIVQKYYYTDKNITALQQQKIFYRLQMVDKDGTTAYSNIAELNVNNNNGIAFFIYPNPAKDKLHINISCAENETLSIRITDMYGREVYAEKISLVAGSVNHDIDIDKFPKGIYTIQLISDKGVSKGKFVKE